MPRAGCIDAIDNRAGGRWFPHVLLAFVVVNLAMVATTGVRMGGDSPLYIDGASALLGGQPLVARQPSYVGYIAAVALADLIGAGLTGVVLVQVAVATVAAAVVYRIGVEFGGPAAGALAVLLLAADVESDRWHAYLLADSLYASLFTVAVWLVYQAQRPDPSTALRVALKSRMVAAVVLLTASLVRPEGWFLIPAAAVYWIWRGVSRRSIRWVSLAGVAASCALLVLFVAPRLTGNLQAVGPGEMLRSGQTIWDFDGWRLTMPVEPPYVGAGGSAANAVSYAVKHPISTASLMLARVGVHLVHVRPFYSAVHNLAIVAWLVPVYVLGGWACWRLRHHALVRWCGAAIATQALVVALTHADYDGRYLAHVLPLWYPVAAVGLVMAAARWRGHNLEVVARG